MNGFEKLEMPFGSAFECDRDTPIAYMIGKPTTIEEYHVIIYPNA